MGISVDALVRRFRHIERTRMRGLPLLNPALGVEALGFRDLAEHRIGVLLTPWFMNLVLLPGTDDWAETPQGERDEVALPSGPIEFTVNRDEELGTYLSAILFRSVTGFADQTMARDVAAEIMSRLWTVVDDVEAPDPAPGIDTRQRRYSRRDLLRGLSDHAAR